MPANSEAKIKANNKYTEANYERFTFRVRKGDKKIIQDYAKGEGKTVNNLILSILQEKIPGLRH